MSALDDAIRMMAKSSAPQSGDRAKRVMDAITRAKAEVAPAEPAGLRSLIEETPAGQEGLWGKIEAQADTPNPHSVSLRDVASRWYENAPGGFDGAVADSQAAMKAYPLPNYVAYGPWPAEAVDRKFPVRSGSLREMADANGKYTPGRREIHLREDALQDQPNVRRGVLEHEVTHGVTLAPLEDDMASPKPTGLGVVGMIDAESPFYADGPVGHRDVKEAMLGAIKRRHGIAPYEEHVAEHLYRRGENELEYTLEAREVDPRLAEIRRRYTHGTGNPVRTPEDAEQAWEWWRNGGAGSTPDDLPTIGAGQFRIYDNLPAPAKQMLLRRMTHVPAWLAPVAASPLAGLGEDGGSGIAK